MGSHVEFARFPFSARIHPLRFSGSEAGRDGSRIIPCNLVMKLHKEGARNATGRRPCITLGIIPPLRTRMRLRLQLSVFDAVAKYNPRPEYMTHMHHECRQLGLLLFATASSESPRRYLARKLCANRALTISEDILWFRVLYAQSTILPSARRPSICPPFFLFAEITRKHRGGSS